MIVGVASALISGGAAVKNLQYKEGSAHRHGRRTYYINSSPRSLILLLSIHLIEVSGHNPCNVRSAEQIERSFL